VGSEFQKALLVTQQTGQFFRVGGSHRHITHRRNSPGPLGPVLPSGFQYQTMSRRVSRRPPRG
jgi:hypothetical protein